MNPEQTFKLIDRIIPFEVCLYHQVIPLSLEGSRLYLGMVDTQDYTALSYLRQLLGYLNCSLVPQEISSETHQSWLSAYLNYTSKAQKKPSNQALIPASVPQESEAQASQPDGETSSQADDLQPPNEDKTHQSDREDRVEDSPQSVLPVLKINAHHLGSPVEVLAMLPPSQLLQELLGRVLMGGIGRLYFERQADGGRILWSQDGRLKSVVEDLSLTTFQGAINELKRFTGLPLLPVKQSKQAEIERLYQQDHLLLRFRATRGPHGEEGTLQVLRGAALKFYRQQKIADLSREALMSAQQLQKQLCEIGECCQSNAGLSEKYLEMLPALEQVLQQVEKEIAKLRNLQ